MPDKGIKSTRRKVLSAFGAGAGVVIASGIGSAGINVDQEPNSQAKSEFKNILYQKYRKSEAEEVYNIVTNYVESVDNDSLISNTSLHRQRVNDKIINGSNTDTITTK
jgi:hypothetical protein